MALLPRPTVWCGHEHSASIEVTSVVVQKLYLLRYSDTTTTTAITTANNNNSIQFFIIYVPSQQPQGQLQIQHSTDIHNYIMDTQHKVKGKLQEHIIAEKQTKQINKQRW
jgi:hypothetical protein